jgi:hypothetical protein
MRRHPLVRASLVCIPVLLGAMVVQGCDGACAMPARVSADFEKPPDIGKSLRDSEGCSVPTPAPTFPSQNTAPNVRGHR